MEITVKPQIMSREAFRVMGVVGHFSSAAANFGPVWSDYMAYDDASDPLRAGEGHYGVYLAADHSKPLDYLAGIPVRDEAALPQGGSETLAVRVLPAATYAVFECRFKDIGPTYGFIWREWLMTSAYEQDTSKFGFDIYPPNTTSGESRVQIWFPVKAKEIAA